MNKTKRTRIGTTVERAVYDQVKVLINLRGITMAEYLRTLLLDDLERRKMLRVPKRCEETTT